MSESSQLPESQYIHGTKANEQRRLSLLNSLINEACLGELRLSGSERILDVGSGLGQFTRAMGRTLDPNGYVLGVERDLEQLADANRQATLAGDEGLVELRRGNALDLPLAPQEWGTFDVAHTRFVLEHVPDPLTIVKGMVRAVRPGGRVVLADDDHAILRLWPDPPGFQTLWDAYIRAYDRLGNDPFVGRRLVSLLHQAGVQPMRNTLVFFGSCAGNPHLSAFVENLTGVIVGARDTVLSNGLFDEAYFDEVVTNLDDWSKRPDAAFWYGICWAEGIRPTSS
jgi:SAM-dependent methyltransferase